MGMYNMIYRVSDIINDLSFMNLYIYQMFSPFHCVRASLGCKTSWVSILVSNDLRSKGLGDTGLSFCELIIDAWSKIDSISILTEFIPLQRVAEWLLNWNMINKEISYHEKMTLIILIVVDSTIYL